MRNKNLYKSFTLLILLSILLIFTITTTFLSQKTTHTHSRAASSTTLNLLPPSSQFVPIQANTGEIVPISIQINPGQSLVSVMVIELDYNPSMLAVNSNNGLQLTPGTGLQFQDGPIYSNGKVQATISVGNNTTAAIDKTMTIATIPFKVIATINGNTPVVTFNTSLTKVVSISANDQADQNVLSTTNPLYIASQSICNNTSPKIIFNTYNQTFTSVGMVNNQIWIGTNNPNLPSHPQILRFNTSGSPIGSPFTIPGTNNQSVTTILQLTPNTVWIATGGSYFIYSTSGNLISQYNTIAQFATLVGNKVWASYYSIQVYNLDGTHTSQSITSSNPQDAPNNLMADGSSVWSTNNNGSLEVFDYQGHILATMQQGQNGLYNPEQSLVVGNQIWVLNSNNTISRFNFDRTYAGAPLTIQLPSDMPNVDHMLNINGTIYLFDGSAYSAILVNSTGQPVCNSPTTYPTAPNLTTTASPSPVTNSNNATVNFNVLLDGIGNAGDNVNPMLNSDSNKNPTHKVLSAVILIEDLANNILYKQNWNNGLQYNPSTGSYQGQLSIPASQGSYYVWVCVASHLCSPSASPQLLLPGGRYTFNYRLVAGDINNDGTIDLLDYNILISCYHANLAQINSCISADLDDDGIVDEKDLNLFIRELSTQ